jgi:hypothetical protein
MRGLKRLFEIHGFKIKHVDGFEYSEEKWRPAGRKRNMRKILNLILPKGLKEGMLVVAKIKSFENSI